MFALFLLIVLALTEQQITLLSVGGAILGGVLFGVGMSIFMGGRIEQVQKAAKTLSPEKIREFEMLYQNEEMPNEKDKKAYLKYLKASRKNSKTLDIFLYIVSAIITADVLYSLSQGGSGWDIITLLIIALLITMTIYGRKKYERVVGALSARKNS